MSFGMIISYTCDAHLKLYILSLVNIKNQPNGPKNSPFPLVMTFFILHIKIL
jgi:hypothetical protein